MDRPGIATTHDRNTDRGKLNHGIAFPLTDSELLLECGIAAAEAGWDGVFVQDHQIDWLAEEPADHRGSTDTWTTLAGIATRTDQITEERGGSPRLQPWVVDVASASARLRHTSL